MFKQKEYIISHNIRYDFCSKHQDHGIKYPFFNVRSLLTSEQSPRAHLSIFFPGDHSYLKIWQSVLQNLGVHDWCCSALAQLKLEAQRNFLEKDSSQLACTLVFYD